MGFYTCESCKGIILDNRTEAVYIYDNKLKKSFSNVRLYKELKENPSTDYHIYCNEYCKKRIEKKEQTIKNALLNSNLVICPDCNNSVSRRAKTCPHCGCPISDINSSNPDELQRTLPQKQTTSHVTSAPNIPKCPTCGSTKIIKMSLANKAGSVALVGVFALGRISKTFKCNNCGHKW